MWVYRHIVNGQFCMLPRDTHITSLRIVFQTIYLPRRLHKPTNVCIISLSHPALPGNVLQAFPWGRSHCQGRGE